MKTTALFGSGWHDSYLRLTNKKTREYLATMFDHGQR